MRLNGRKENKHDLVSLISEKKLSPYSELQRTHVLQVLYIDGSSLDSDPASLPLTGCGDPCYLDYLVNSTQRFVNVNYEEECQSTTQTVMKKPTVFRNISISVQAVIQFHDLLELGRKFLIHYHSITISTIVGYWPVHLITYY